METNPIDPINIPAYQRQGKITQRKKTQRIRKLNRLTDIPARQEILSVDSFPRTTTNKIEKKLEKDAELREMKICGRCEGYFEKINVAVIRVTSPIRKGDRLIFEKEKGLFEQTLNSMQVDRKDINLARSGTEIGTKVFMEPKVGAPVYKLI
jgi:hypothetical protein